MATQMKLYCKNCGFSGHLTVSKNYTDVYQNIDFYLCPWCGGNLGGLVQKIISVKQYRRRC